MRCRGPVVALAALAVLCASTPALAEHADQTDPNDVRGLLDLEEVRFRHERGPYVWVFKTYGAWKTKRIWDTGFLVVQLDTIGSTATDFLVVLRSVGKEVQGELFRRRRDGTEVHRRTLDGWRAGSKGGAVQVPRRWLTFGPKRTVFRWSANSLFTGDRCRSTCIDAVPDEGTVEQSLDE